MNTIRLTIAVDVKSSLESWDLEQEAEALQADLEAAIQTVFRANLLKEIEVSIPYRREEFPLGNWSCVGPMIEVDWKHEHENTKTK